MARIPIVVISLPKQPNFITKHLTHVGLQADGWLTNRSVVAWRTRRTYRLNNFLEVKGYSSPSSIPLPFSQTPPVASQNILKKRIPHQWQAKQALNCQKTSPQWWDVHCSPYLHNKHWTLYVDAHMPQHESKKKKMKPTTPAVPRRSPIQVLGRPDAA